MGAAIAVLSLLVTGVMKASTDAVGLYSSITSQLEERVKSADKELEISHIVLAANKKEIEDLKSQEIKLNDKIEKANLELTKALSSAAVLGLSIGSCNTEFLRKIFNEVTRRYNNSRGDRLTYATKYDDFSMETFLLGDSRTRFIIYGKHSTMRASDRRSAAGYWRIDDGFIEIEFAFDDNIFDQSIRISESDLTALGKGSVKKIIGQTDIGDVEIFPDYKCGRY